MKPQGKLRNPGQRADFEKKLQEEDEKFMEWYRFQGNKAERDKLFEEYLKVLRRNNAERIKRW